MTDPDHEHPIIELNSVRMTEIDVMTEIGLVLDQGQGHSLGRVTEDLTGMTVDLGTVIGDQVVTPGQLPGQILDLTVITATRPVVGLVQLTEGRIGRQPLIQKTILVVSTATRMDTGVTSAPTPKNLRKHIFIRASFERVYKSWP